MARHMQRMRMQLKPESLGLTQAEDSEGSQDEAVVEDGQEADTPFNPFDLLNPEEDGVFSEPDGEQSDGAEQGLREGDTRAGTVTVSKSSTKRKKKKKKGKDQKTVVSEPSEGQASIDKAEDEIDRIVREVMDTSIAAAGPAAGSAADSERVRSGQATSTSSVLVVEPRALRPEEELKAMFGADVIAAEAREAADEERRRRGARNPKGVRGLSMRGRMLRKLILYQPREQWLLRVDEGISMECLGMQNGRVAFRYRFTPAYEAVQKAFEGQAASHDPNVVAALLDRCPYHLDGLLAMHHLCQAMGEGEYAEAMLNRCLHVLELAWHPAFKPVGGACALPYEHRENRLLFTALHLHIRGLTRRGCHRTALEFSKLLLGLDHQDPVGVLFLVDYLALRSREYEFLHRLADAPQLQHGGSLRLLPGLSFSLALAAFYRQRQRGGGGGGGEAQDALMQAVLTFPCQVTALLRKIRDRGGGKDARWTSVLAHRLFAHAEGHGSDTLAHLTLLYAERCHALWEPSDVLQGLLYAACFACTEVVDGTRSWRGGAPPQSWARVCLEAYPPSATNDFRHVRLADMSDSSGALPREEVEAAMAGADDLDLAALIAQQQRQRPGGGVHVDAEELQAAHPLVMLLRSLLPWVDAGATPDYRDAADDPPA